MSRYNFMELPGAATGSQRSRLYDSGHFPLSPSSDRRSSLTSPTLANDFQRTEPDLQHQQQGQQEGMGADLDTKWIFPQPDLAAPLSGNRLFDCGQGRGLCRRPRSPTVNRPEAPPAIQQYKTLKLHAPNHGPRNHRFSSVHPRPTKPPRRTPSQTPLTVRAGPCRSEYSTAGRRRNIENRIDQKTNADRSPAPKPLLRMSKIRALK